MKAGQPRKTHTFEEKQGKWLTSKPEWTWRK